MNDTKVANTGFGRQAGAPLDDRFSALVDRLKEAKQSSADRAPESIFGNAGSARLPNPTSADGAAPVTAPFPSTDLSGGFRKDEHMSGDAIKIKANPDDPKSAYHDHLKQALQQLGEGFFVPVGPRIPVTIDGKLPVYPLIPGYKKGDAIPEGARVAPVTFSFSSDVPVAGNDTLDKVKAFLGDAKRGDGGEPVLDRTGDPAMNADEVIENGRQARFAQFLAQKTDPTRTATGGSLTKLVDAAYAPADQVGRRPHMHFTDDKIGVALLAVALVKNDPQVSRGADGNTLTFADPDNPVYKATPDDVNDVLANPEKMAQVRRIVAELAPVVAPHFDGDRPRGGARGG